MRNFSIIVDSDLEFGYFQKEPKIRKSKKGNVTNIQKCVDKHHNIKAIFILGNLTHSNSNGKRLLCLDYGGTKNEVEAVFKQYIRPIERSNVPIKIIPGCKDIKNPRSYPYYPALSLIKKISKKGSGSYKIGNFVDSFDIDDVHFCLLDLYPNKVVCEWLAKDLKDRNGQPIVLLQHYDCDSDDWSQEEKDRFFETIRYNNIILIVEGHSHTSSADKKFHNIPRIDASGPGFIHIHFIDDNIEIENIY